MHDAGVPDRRGLAHLSSREGWVERLVELRPGLTRADVAEATGLSGSTVKTVVARLIDRSRVTEEGSGASSGRGRRPPRLFARLPHAATAGIALGHDRTVVAVGDLAGRVLIRRETPSTLEGDPAEAITAAAALLVDAYRDLGPDAPPLAAVVAALPGPILRDDTRVGSPSVLSHWSGISVGEHLRQTFAVPVLAGNDANLAALAELHLGAGRGLSDFVYLEVSRGVGAGLVMDGTVRDGYAGFAGEIGHVQVDPQGALCRCGQHGCLEVTVNAPEVMRRLRSLNVAGGALELSGYDDAVSARVLRDAGGTLGKVLAVVCSVVNTQAVVIGGDLRDAPAAYREGILAAIHDHTQPVVAADVRVLAGTVAEPAVRGALIRGCEHVRQLEERGTVYPRHPEESVIWRGSFAQ